MLELFMSQKELAENFPGLKDTVLSVDNTIECFGRADGEFNGFYNKHHTEETKKQISEKLKGRVTYTMTDEIRKKISETLKGNVPWNKGLKGHCSGEKNGMFGKHHTEENNRKNSEKKKEWFKHNEHPFKGKHHTEESLKKMKWTDETRRKWRFTRARKLGWSI